MHAKDFGITFLDEYVFYVCYDKITIMPPKVRFSRTMLFYVLCKARKKIFMTGIRVGKYG